MSQNSGEKENGVTVIRGDLTLLPHWVSVECLQTPAVQ